MGPPDLDPRNVLFLRKALIIHMRKMVHSGIIFWPKKLCKRRPFLSDLGMCLSGHQVARKWFHPVLADSGGASLHWLTEVLAGSSQHCLPPESGNIELRLLASGQGPKRALRARTACTTMTSAVYNELRYAVRVPGVPPIKVAGAQKSTFARIPGSEILYRI